MKTKNKEIVSAEVSKKVYRDVTEEAKANFKGNKSEMLRHALEQHFVSRTKSAPLTTSLEENTTREA